MTHRLRSLSPFASRTFLAALLCFVASLFACGAAPDDGGVGSSSDALVVCKPPLERYCEPGEYGKLVCVCEPEQTDPPDAAPVDASHDTGSSCPVGQQMCGCTLCPSYCTANMAYCLDLTNGYCAPASHCAQH